MRKYTDLSELTRTGEGDDSEWGDPLSLFTAIGYPEITEGTSMRTGVPLLAIYYTGDTTDVAINGTNIELTHDGVTVNIAMLNRTCAQIAGAINKLSMPYSANTLFDAENVSTYEPIVMAAPNVDLTVDGATIIRGKGHVVKALEETQIRILPPYNDSRYDPWYIVINRGWVTRVSNGDSWKFTVPEYEKQTWSTKYGFGFIDIEDVVGERLGPQALGVPRAPIHWDRGNLQLVVNETIQPSSVVRDVDVHNGIIYLNREYSGDETILVNYTYREDGYVYDKANLNPTEFHTPGVVDRYVVFYLVPYANADGVLRQDCVRHAESSTLGGAINQIPRNDEPIMILGATQVRQVHDYTEVDITDTRTRGGGVKWDEFTRARKRNRDIMSTADRGFYDGHPYPGNMALFVTLPSELKDTLSKAEIDGTIKRFVEYGTYTFVEFD